MVHYQMFFPISPQRRIRLQRRKYRDPRYQILEFAMISSLTMISSRASIFCIIYLFIYYVDNKTEFFSKRYFKKKKLLPYKIHHVSSCLSVYLSQAFFVGNLLRLKKINMVGQIKDFGFCHFTQVY